MKRKTKTKKATEKDEVEELLQAAQDDMLLKLSLDSHISRGVSLGDADVDRRFHALKHKTTIGAGARGAGGGAAAAPSKSKSNSDSNSNSNSNAIQVDEELKAVLGDDLSARFAALKASDPKPSSSSPIQVDAAATLYDDSDDEEDEVEKLIRWAKDAARLDPSPPSESDDDDETQNKKGNGPDCK